MLLLPTINIIIIICWRWSCWSLLSRWLVNRDDLGYGAAVIDPPAINELLATKKLLATDETAIPSHGELLLL